MRSSMVSGHGADDDGQPSPEGLERWYRSRQQPENEVPVAVPFTAVLGRTEALAVVLTSVHACSTGFGFQVCLRLRRSPAPGDDVYGQFTSSAGAGGQFLLGVEFADGRRGSVLGGPGDWPPQPGAQGSGQEVSLSGTGGGGGGRSFDQGWWVAPLPPDGPLRLVVRWDAQELQEAVTEVDGAAVARAGRSAQVLWPWEPDRAEGGEPEGPRRPTSGWFAQP